MGLPSEKLSKTVDNLCLDIIANKKPVYPPGYVPMTQQETTAVGGGGKNPFENSNYMKKMKIRGGAFAILMAFYLAPQRHDMTENQLCAAAQPFCDEEG